MVWTYARAMDDEFNARRKVERPRFLPPRHCEAIARE